MLANGTVGMLAPIVMGALGNMQRQEALDPRGVSSALQREQQQIEQSGNPLMAMATRLLDANRDGSALDDVIGMAGRFFQRPRG